MSMSEQAKEARREYNRNWAREHPDKIKRYKETYWTKKAAEAADKKKITERED